MTNRFRKISRKACRYVLSAALGLAPLAGAPAWAAAGEADYQRHTLTLDFIDEMVKQEGFDPETLQQLFAQAERQQVILDAIARPAEKTKPWKDYRNIFLTRDRIQRGVAFWRRHREALERAEYVYGVPAEIIVAIIGVETRYGANKGRFRVLDALSTLAFDYPPRAKFFRKQLKEFLLLAREERIDPLTLEGSYAGAMGYPQFIPSSFRHYAVDFDGDGRRDIWNNPVDAIGSVANYFRAHKWQTGAPVVSAAQAKPAASDEVVNGSLKPRHTVAELARLGYTAKTSLPGELNATVMRLEGVRGPEYWIGLHNFYVITRYNHSKLYAMAVYQLSQAIKQQDAAG